MRKIKLQSTKGSLDISGHWRTNKKYWTKNYQFWADSDQWERCNRTSRNLRIKLINDPNKNKKTTGKLVGIKWCKVHKEWLIKSLLNPKRTKLNIVIKNEKKYIFFTAHFNWCFPGPEFGVSSHREFQHCLHESAPW